MRPDDHPDFYRLPPPDGRSRESSIRLDSRGRFWEGGLLVQHPRLVEAFHRWIRRHPDSGRYILSNGYDWTYFTVDEAPYAVKAVRVERGGVVLVLSDGTEERWRPEVLADPEGARVAKDGALFTRVKGQFEAKFSPHAQASLVEVLESAEGPAWAAAFEVAALRSSRR